MKGEHKLPAISIIVPVYKAEKYLGDCLESIICQTFTDFELILVDDGSPDRSGQICAVYAEKDERIRVIHKKNEGASAARNTGVEAARGTYIGWVDADDRIEPDMYETLYKLAMEYKADIADCQYYMLKGDYLEKNGQDKEIVSGSGDFILKEFFSARMKPVLWSKLYKRELWNDIRFPLGRNHHDFYVNVKFALMPLTYVRTPEAKYYYIIRENSITTSYTSRQLRQTIYLYDYTMDLAEKSAKSDLAKKYLTRDAVSRLMWRYSEIAIKSRIKNQRVYNYYVRKKLGMSLVRYILLSDLPIKTRISYILLLSNLKNLQAFLHKYLGKKAYSMSNT